jgi:methylated-DNA-[protein]-cysteine S-methyltransferase
MKISVRAAIGQFAGGRGLPRTVKTAIVNRMKTSKQYAYSVFMTNWGWFGLLSGDLGLTRTCLPMASKNAVEKALLNGIDGAMAAKNRLGDIENAVIAYYKGQQVDFSGVDVNLEAFTPFQKRVLLALRNVKHGQTVTYGNLAAAAGSPKAARAIGACMAKNPLPLIIPCHRVIGSNGALTGFTAPGGTQTKRKMLNLEQS